MFERTELNVRLFVEEGSKSIPCGFSCSPDEQHLREKEPRALAYDRVGQSRVRRDGHEFGDGAVVVSFKVGPDGGVDASGQFWVRRIVGFCDGRGG
jgi:hypothetical protein